MNQDLIKMLLIVEDNPGDARLIREMLAEQGLNDTVITHVNCMSEAEAYLADHEVDILLVDLGLPDAQGLEAVQRARASAPRVPLVALTGLNDQLVAQQALLSGAQDYLIKGQTESQALLQALRYAIDRNRREDALFLERERAELTLNGIGDAVASTDADGKIVFLNLAAEALTGWTLNDAAGRPFDEVVRVTADGDHPIVLDPTNTGRGDGVPPELTTTLFLLQGLTGLSTPVECSMSTIHDRGGGASGAVVILRDVTERRLAERQVLKSNERFQRLFDANTIGIAITDLAGRTYEANDFYLEMLGYSREEFEANGLKWEAVTPPEDGAKDRLAMGELQRSGVAQSSEKELVRKDGTRVPVLLGVAMLEQAEGTCITYVVDLSKRRFLEAQLRQAQKMEAIGQLASGIAHDFNNLLTVIIGNAELLKAQLESEAPIADLDEILGAAHRAVSMTGQLLAFSRQQVLEPMILDLSARVEGLNRILNRLIGEDIDLVTSLLPPRVACVRADAGQIDQLVMNLAINARDAMPWGGKLHIGLSLVEINSAEAARIISVPGDKFVKLTVRDSGTGMNDDTMSHLFEPFFTTKGVGKGTGLGLATAYGVVRQSNGEILVQSEVGVGSTFDVYFPLAAAQTEENAVAAAEATAVPENGTVLLVEDDPSIRILARRILETAGFTIIECSGAEIALSAALNHPGAIDLLLTDVVMPGMGGTELSSELTRLRPEMRTVYMSGYNDDTILAEGLLTHKLNFLQKPFTLQSLTQKVRAALA